MAHIRNPWDTAIELADRHAPFLRHLLRTEEDIPSLLKDHGPEPLLKALHEGLAKIDPATIRPDALMRQLRSARGRAALIIALADLSGLWSVDQVTAALSDFADICIHLAVQVAIAQALKAKRLPLKRAPRAEQLQHHGLACLALGKLGGRELNYSSDVDLIFVYDETRVLPDSEATDAWSKVVHQAARYLQEPTEDGYCFRVDLRLRPDPGATPPAISMAAAENYYQSAALTWERAAYTRARVCGGDRAAGEAFLDRLSGWVWRRSLDFTAIRDVHALREQILEHFDLEQFDPAGFDVKRGIGGIREIEFLLQIHQLIHGGRRPELRISHTPEGLHRLATLGVITGTQAALLIKSYHWLRLVEHRLQMINDEQTHDTPKNVTERTQLASFCGFKTLASFEQQLTRTCTHVRKTYLKILGQDTSPVPAKSAGRKIAQADVFITRWQSGRYRALTHPRARAALEKIQPVLFGMISKAPDPDATLLRWDQFLEQLPAGVALLEMFEANPNLLGLIVRIMSLSTSTGEQLARRPQLLDAVLDADFFSVIARPEEELELASRSAQDIEAHWSDTARWVAEKRFQLSVQLLDQLLTPREAARQLAAVLDAAVRKLLTLSHQDLSRQYGRFAENAPVILALGGWGGQALGLKSDLDMVLLFTGQHDAMSDGAKSITAGHYFNKLVPRLTNLLTATSSDGAIAEVDTRLRPSGAKGLLAVSLDSFTSYQINDAWTWEHMALTRARLVAGPLQPVANALAHIFAQRRDPEKIRADILDMRTEMDQHRAAKSDWDMKLPPGGLIDIEFILHALQVLHAAKMPALVTPALEDAADALARAKLLSAAHASQLRQAWELQFAVRAMLTLCADGDATTHLSKPVQTLLARTLAQKNLASVEKSIHQARYAVLDIWPIIFKQSRTL